ncbi:hypothetical protein Pmani_020275 [Petrolisthes manimaculis]|uniref:acid phosphatase n=1 Tax=Petrolisthes manimaculis TaxID=1843537 RepID=A0AAE1U2R3_9EUCA|nr:hypothetical protein Pmani_034719 [Petrolisthes manimaculis]KAK4307998.1 hypothetical protein Pmani_020275 [Petrolisthes manimaculis]
MHYKLGRWLRLRYGGFISRRWQPGEVTVRSTDVDRTLMSAACNLAAFYRPDQVDERFEDDLPWLPTPINTVPLDSDKLMSVDLSCPRVKEELALEAKLPEVMAVMKANAQLFPYLSKHTHDNITTIISVDYLHDTLYIESLYNLTIPAWAQKVMPQMKELASFSFKMAAMTPQLKRLRAGPLIKEMSDNMRTRANNASSPARMHMYSGHDTTLAVLMQGLGVYNGVPPPYATTFIIELHNINGQRFVKMYLMNDSSLATPPHSLTLPGCRKVCPLDTWLSLAGVVVPDDWTKECHATTHPALVFGTGE